MPCVKRLLLCTLALALLAASPAPDYPAFDRDGDGVIDRAEYQAVAARLFIRADRNFDGFLEGDETAAVQVLEREADQIRRFRRADTDGDGLMSEAEMLASARARDDRRLASRSEERLAYDRNGDGWLNAEETVLMKDAKRKARQAKGRQAIQPPTPQANAAQADTKPPTETITSVQDLLNTVRANALSHTKDFVTSEGIIRPQSRPYHDTDMDQRVSLAEYRAGLSARFDKRDKDGNGELDAQERGVSFIFAR